MSAQINIFELLALLELLLVGVGLSVFFFFRSRKQKKQIDKLNQKLKKRKIVTQIVHNESSAPAEQKTFRDFLQDEIDDSSVMLGESSGLERLDDEPMDESDEEASLRQLFAVRHQFLQLEMDGQALSNDPESKRQHLMEGLQSLVTALTPEPIIQDVSSELTDGNVLAREQQLQNQIEALRHAVTNQHDVMKDLRRLLEEHLEDSDEAREILQALEDAETQSRELESHLAELTSPDAADVAATGMAEAVEGADTDMLRNLVGNQQNTIDKLKHMLAEAIPDAQAAEGLKQAVDKVQRANQELGTCVLVLEDENSRLRTEVETLQTRMQDIELAEDQSDATTSSATEPVEMMPEPVSELEPEPEPEPVAADSVPPASEKAAESVPSGDADNANAEPADKPAAMDTVTGTEALSETAQDIDALLEAAAEDPPGEVSPSGNAGEASAGGKTNVEDGHMDETTQAAFDEVDALLAEIAEDNEKKPQD